MVLVGCSSPQEKATTEAETTAPISLFNGKDLEGWHIDVPDMDTDSTLESPFLVREGMLVSMGNPNGHIITDAEYSNYELEVEYRFAGEPGNCGVLVHASTPRSLYEMFTVTKSLQWLPSTIDAESIHPSIFRYVNITDAGATQSQQNAQQPHRIRVPETYQQPSMVTPIWQMSPALPQWVNYNYNYDY